MIIPTGFSAFSGNIGPLNRVTPFTHRDNATFLRILQEVIQFINETLRPEMDSELQRILDEFQTQLDASNAGLAATQAEWLAAFNQFMVDVTAEIALLNDAAIGSLVDNTLSVTSVALNKRYRTQVLTTAVGDGVANDTAAILANANTAVALGIELVLDGTKTYAVDGLVLPANLKLVTNGAKLKKLVNNNVYAVKVSGNTRADFLNVELTGGVSNDAGIHVSGSDTVIQKISVVSLTANQVGTNALFVGDESAPNIRKNIALSNIVLTGFRSPMRVKNVANSRFSNAAITNFLTGVYVIDVTNTVFDKFVVTGTSATATGGAGENGLLLEAQAADYSVSNVRFRDWFVEGAPEHSYRIGGALSVAHITFEDCVSRLSGNAAANISTGGGAFKALGIIDHWHTDIRYINCTSEDSNPSANGINNFSQFSFGFIDGLFLQNPVVRRRNNVTYSARVGLYLNSVKNVDVVNPRFSDMRHQAVIIQKDGTDASHAGVTNVRINGGFLDVAATDTQVIRFDTLSTVTKNVFIDTTVSRGGHALRAEATTVQGIYTGAYTECHVKIRYMDAPVAGGVSPVQGGNLLTLDYTGPLYGAGGLPSLNGGYELDTTTGNRFIRKALAWAAM